MLVQKVPEPQGAGPGPQLLGLLRDLRDLVVLQVFFLIVRLLTFVPRNLNILLLAQLLLGHSRELGIKFAAGLAKRLEFALGRILHFWVETGTVLRGTLIERFFVFFIQ